MANKNNDQDLKQNNIGWVYIAKDDGNTKHRNSLKIGMTEKTPEKRYTDKDGTIAIFGIKVKNALEMEAMLHNAFSIWNSKVSGKCEQEEWFGIKKDKEWTNLLYLIFYVANN